MRTRNEAIEWLKAYIKMRSGWIKPQHEKNFRKAIKILERETKNAE